MFWVFYVVFALFFSYLVSIPSKKSNVLIFYFSLVILLTPAQIEIGSEEYAPALFSFFFNVLLEQDYSVRALRPLVLTIPSSLFILLLFFYFKKRFF